MSRSVAGLQAWPCAEAIPCGFEAQPANMAVIASKAADVETRVIVVPFS
jgi:hypothetical protein